MNKLVIPAILAATVLVAGMFAFMPVERATTVHTAILAGIRDVNTVDLNGLPVNSAIVLYDGLGNNKSVKAEIVAKLPTGAKIQSSSTITGGAVVWADVTCGTTVDFGAGAVHCDVETKALRVLTDGTNAGAAGHYVTVTINGV